MSSYNVIFNSNFGKVYMLNVIKDKYKNNLVLSSRNKIKKNVIKFSGKPCQFVKFPGQQNNKFLYSGN